MPKNCRPWTKDEINYIRDHYTDMEDKAVAEVLGRPFRSVRAKRVRLGLFRYFQEATEPIKGEKWTKVIDYPEYEVSNKGRVRNRLGRLLTPHVHKSGYLTIAMAGKTKYLHVIVKESFDGKTPEGYEIDHKDSNKLNSALYNLEFVTHQENMQRAVDNGCFKHLFGR